MLIFTEDCLEISLTDYFQDGSGLNLSTYIVPLCWGIVHSPKHMIVEPSGGFWEVQAIFDFLAVLTYINERECLSKYLQLQA